MIFRYRKQRSLIGNFHYLMIGKFTISAIRYSIKSKLNQGFYKTDDGFRFLGFNSSIQFINHSRQDD